ncbi:MAG: hypothetical protein ABFR89_10935 [Actinomycetota bacterium]
MTRHDEALEQMRSANPLPGIDHVDVDELALSRSHFEERRLAMTTRAPTPRDLSRTRPVRSWRPAIVAVSAFVLVIALFGIGAVVLRGSEVPLVDPAESVATTAIPPATTIADEPAAVVPEQPTVEPGVRVLSEEPEYNARLALGAGGLPMVLSTTRTGDEYPGTARLFRCADVACDAFKIETIEPEPGPSTLAVAQGTFVVAPNGDIYAGISAEGGLGEVGWLHDGVLERLPVLGNWPVHSIGEATEPVPYMPLPSAFDDDGNPVFVTYHGAFPASANLLVCNDPACGNYVEVEFDSATFHDGFPEILIDGDSARLVYSTGEPTGPFHPEEIGMTEQESQVKIATIIDLFGSPSVSIEIVDDDPRVFGEVDSEMRPISVYTEVVYEPDEYAAYIAEEQRIAEEGLDQGAEEPEALGANYVVARCLDSACTSTERTTIAATDAPWQFLYQGSFDLEVAADGTIIVLMAGGEDSWNPGLQLFVFPNGELGPSVEPIAGHAVIEWPAP